MTLRWPHLTSCDLTLPYMSQMLYAGQSARESVTFLSDFYQLYRAQFMCLCCEILIEERQLLEKNDFSNICLIWSKNILTFSFNYV